MTGGQTDVSWQCNDSCSIEIWEHVYFEMCILKAEFQKELVSLDII